LDKKEKITDKIGDVESRMRAKGGDLVIKVLEQVVRGVYFFKGKKGDVLAAAVTFFVLMGFFPIMLLIISVYSKIVGDVDVAYGHVISGIKDGVPNLAPWIMTSIQKIVKTHMQDSAFLNWVNILVLGFVGLEFSSSLIFGINTLSDNKSKGGIFDDIKSLFGGLFIGVYILILLFLTSGANLIIGNFTEGSIIQSIVSFRQPCVI
jgi:uncharacterized BrkB/YihY/UPF0761 family membrane protein